MPVKNIIFDLGKVLVDFSFDNFFRFLGHDPRQRDLSEANDPILSFEAGKINKIEFFQRIKKIWDFDISLEQFEFIWCNIFTPIPEMIALARMIQQNYEIFIFSNTDELHFPFIWKKFSQLHFFGKNLMLSYKLGAVKPEREAYDRALSSFSLEAAECIFIDDRSINVDTAVKTGFQGIVHRSFQQTCLELQELIAWECLPLAQN
ncbi:MAG: HAD family phosphatase [Candidatus Cloacimonetes bacterium]|nr:HAD family phosphatase [Candidatus Cloacimonadota bacterium]